MSHLQRAALTPHSAPSNQCLTGCLYQVIQTTEQQGLNVLKLLPIPKPKDRRLPVVPSPLTPSVPTPNVPQTVLPSPPPPPPPVSILSRPSPVSVPLVQTPALGNYIIAPQNNLTNTVVPVETTFPLSPETLFVDNAQLSFPANSVAGNQTIIMMNKKTASPVRPTPTLPAGHSLQIPAHAEVISIPVSSLPFSIQQKILPQTSGTAAGKVPSVIYVSPVNTIKSSNNQTTQLCPTPNTSNVTSKSPPQQRPPANSSEAPKGPMKWVVQESQESAACLVPVKSSNDEASKILQMLSKTKMEEVNLTNPDHSKVVQIKDNALVMCNNKIFFLTKKGTELIGAGSKNVEPLQYSSPDKPAARIEPMNDLSNKVVQVVLSKNKSPPPVAEQSVQSNVVSTAKPKRKSSTPRPARGVPSDLYVPEDEGCSNASVTPREPPGDLPDTANKSDRKQNDQLLPKSQGTEIPTAKAPEVNAMDDTGWRLRFGLLKQEKIILKRVPLIRPQSPSPSDTSAREEPSSPAVDDVMDPEETQQNQWKRKSLNREALEASKKQKSSEEDDLNQNTINPDRSTDFPCPSTVAESYSAPGGRSPETTERSSSSWSPAYYGEDASYPPDSADFHQDITGHFSHASLPAQRYHIDSMYPDDTTKDEKIQRLKEVLKEREKALEALRQRKA